MYGLSGKEYFWLVVFSHFLLVFGTVLFWLGFIFMGRVAKKYEKILSFKTNWIFLYVAPSGYLIFSFLILGSGVIKGYIKPPIPVEWASYTVFLLSSIAVILGIVRFSLIIFKK